MTHDPVSGTPRGSAPRGGHPCVHLEGGCGISSQCTTRGHSGRSGSLVTPYVAGQSFSEVPTQITSGRSETRPAPLPSAARRGSRGRQERRERRGRRERGRRGRWERRERRGRGRRDRTGPSGAAGSSGASALSEKCTPGGRCVVYERTGSGECIFTDNLQAAPGFRSPRASGVASVLPSPAPGRRQRPPLPSPRTARARHGIPWRARAREGVGISGCPAERCRRARHPSPAQPGSSWRCRSAEHGWPGRRWGHTCRRRRPARWSGRTAGRRGSRCRC